MESSPRLEGGFDPKMSARSLDSFTHSFDIGQVEGRLVLCFGERGFGMLEMEL